MAPKPRPVLMINYMYIPGLLSTRDEQQTGQRRMLLLIFHYGSH